MSVNKVFLLGFVGQEPKVDNLNTGSKVSSFSIATTERGYTTANGTKVEDKTEWHNVVAWGKIADIVEKYVRKGSKLHIEGKLKTRSYDDKTGIKRYVTEIIAENIQLLDSRAQQSTNSEQQTSAGNSIPTPSVDDLPF